MVLDITTVFPLCRLLLLSFCSLSLSFLSSLFFFFCMLYLQMPIPFLHLLFLIDSFFKFPWTKWHILWPWFLKQCRWHHLVKIFAYIFLKEGLSWRHVKNGLSMLIVWLPWKTKLSVVGKAQLFFLHLSSKLFVLFMMVLQSSFKLIEHHCWRANECRHEMVVIPCLLGQQLTLIKWDFSHL